MTIKRCGWCKHGIKAMDGETPFTICAVIPPAPVVGPDPETGKDKLHWVRPNMSVKGWCGQFGFSLLRWLGYGARA